MTNNSWTFNGTEEIGSGRGKQKGFEKEIIASHRECVLKITKELMQNHLTFWDKEA